MIKSIMLYDNQWEKLDHIFRVYMLRQIFCQYLKITAFFSFLICRLYMLYLRKCVSNAKSNKYNGSNLSKAGYIFVGNKSTES